MGEADPFERARVAQRRTVVRALALVCLLLVVVGAVIAGVRALPSRRQAGARPIVRELGGTSFSETPDRATGWRRIVSAIPQRIVVAAAAIGRDGTFSMAFSRRGDVGDRVLSWHAGAFRVAYATASQVTALAVSPEGETWIGTMTGGILIMRRDGTVVPSAQRTSGTSISEFAFDAASGKTAVLISNGEVFTGLRGRGAAEEPLQPGVLAPVTLPPHARSRHALYDDDGDLVLAGDAGAIFVATSSGWDDRTLAATGDVAAIALDRDGALVAAQSTGHVWRSTGATWEAAGHVPHPPLAIGDLPDRGLVVATDDGLLFSVVSERDGALAPGYAATVDEPVFAAQIAGANVLFTSVHRVRIWDGATWDSANERVTGGAHDCQRPGGRDALARGDADRVVCGTSSYRVRAGGPLVRDATSAAAAPDAGSDIAALFEGARLDDVTFAHGLLETACAGGVTFPCVAIHELSLLPVASARIGSTARIALYGLVTTSGPPVPGLTGELAPSVAPAGEIFVRLRDGPTPRAEILDLPQPLVEVDFVGPSTRMFAAGERVVVLRPGVVATIAADGPARLLTLPAPGLVPTALWRDTGAIAVGPHGDLALLVDQQSARRILRCHGGGCVLLDGPPRDDATMAVGFTTDDHLYVITGDHDVAVQTR